MEKFTTHTGVGVPLTRTNVDTDQIIPARYLKRVTRTGFEDGLFSNWRENEATFVLNQDAFKDGSVLFAGEDFGTGSSREHAVWALMDYGFRAVFSPRFADIFRGNAGKAGLLAGIMSHSDIELIWKHLEQHPGDEAIVSLEDCTVTVGGNTFTFEIDDYTRWRLMEGLDDIGLTLRDEPAIERFEATRPAFKPSVAG
ncbi:3-isopropylmalate dehydratase small subunit [Corynebacterium sp. HMSC05C01]|uniref:3-isopropylmalate dehydratase small subunit n=1 Tax=Corynebacterium TaxID=1716 RepID=UPI0008A18DFB|nr:MULTISPECIES: 3-isopropylmalate dehydratase small subunit [Corynebacterium]MDK8798759.1 3-isopropylmalate dehydratase small subunit [Corynebacterium coyleae]OFO34971.1 3-isopropylmalate dehydratase small subunit [Corynebacterium sp. HMSC075D04]OFT68473.1 3-isopropylmalate dehydratase small subunit [Corynebacterium sp. HMSC05C01]OHO30922.1 3-isopropylmalate dehydratase small subunit [Corynebacterium sp. HMSC034B08]OHO80606.1 3-isopropylmalate dehydratase small subunit [Corynebacterium sp. HM